jgi:hypothetical protein
VNFKPIKNQKSYKIALCNFGISNKYDNIENNKKIKPIIKNDTFTHQINNLIQNLSKSK